MTGHAHDYQTYYLGDGSKAVLECEIISAPASRGISEWREGVAESWGQQTQYLLWSTTLVDNLKRERERARDQTSST